MDDADDEARLRYERAADWPMTAAALLFLAAWAFPIIHGHLGHGWSLTCVVVQDVVWAAFVVDYVIRLVLARRRGAFVRSSWLDLLVVVLPFFRPLRLLRLVKLLTVFDRHAGSSLHTRVASYSLGGTVLLLFIGATAELSVERGRPGASVNDFGHAAWWAISTITTVGYGDVRPVTATGKWIAAGLMVTGIALVGVVAATFASWLLSRVVEQEEEVQRPTRDDVEVLVSEVRGLRAEIAELREAVRDRSAHPQR